MTVSPPQHDVEAWDSQERRYSHNYSTFTKIEIPSWSDVEGKTQRPWRSRERLANEYTALKYIAEKTTIPVPKPLRLEYIDGCCALTTEWVDGVPFDDLDPEIRSTTYLDNYVRSTILPQLRALRSHTSGTIDGVVLPPRRVFDSHSQRQWRPWTSETEEYSFSHNDLSQHNFLCDPKTGKIVAIIDWEFAGYYPDFFEAPLWLAPYYETKVDPEEVKKLLDFLEPVAQVVSNQISTESSPCSSGALSGTPGSLPLSPRTDDLMPSNFALIE
jgi:Phosphotransferase enzyme family